VIDREPVRRHPRGRPWWRSRGVILAVVLVDVLGLAALAVALTRSTSVKRASAAAADPPEVRANPQDPLTQTIATGAPPAPAPHRVRHRHAAAVPALATRSALDPSALGASFQQFAAGQPGAVGVVLAPLGAGPVVTFGALQLGHAWSTMKVPVLTTVLAELERRGGSLGAQGSDLATRALEASDNSAAEGLFAGLERSDGGLTGASAAVQDTLRRAGDGVTVVNTAPNSGGFTTWGQSEWSAAGEVTFYRALANGCLLSAEDTSYVLGLMRNVESDQRWGAGSAGIAASVPVAFKGGWGPEDGAGYLVRQSAIIGDGDRGYVLHVMAKPSNGSFATGADMTTQTAAWVAHNVPASLQTGPTSCN
jgi:beta-lactamase class A